MRSGDWELALGIAVRFDNLGEHAAAIERGHEAYVHARFYRQLGKDPETLKEEGKRALITRFGR